MASFPEWQLEDDRLFNAMLPDAAGACPAGFLPLYRLYNNGKGGAPNHRFVISLGEQRYMVNQGWIAEGAWHWRWDVRAAVIVQRART